MKLVISTNALIGRRPMAIKRSASHLGLGPFLTPLIKRPAKAGQASGASILIETGQGKLPGTAAMARSFNVPRPAAASSRAIPATPSQSGRLGVTSKSITASSRPSAAAAGRPMAKPASSSRMPSLSSAVSSSAAEQSIPFETTPRTARGSSVIPLPGIKVPKGA